jgi:hypothetical protein
MARPHYLLGEDDVLYLMSHRLQSTITVFFLVSCMHVKLDDAWMIHGGPYLCMNHGGIRGRCNRAFLTASSI